MRLALFFKIHFQEMVELAGQMSDGRRLPYLTRASD
jgi:hypothetical protein